MMAVAAIVLAFLATTVQLAEVTLSDDVNSVENIREEIENDVEPLVNVTDTDSVIDDGDGTVNGTFFEQSETGYDNTTTSTRPKSRWRNGDAADDSPETAEVGDALFNVKDVNGSLIANQSSLFPDTVGLNATDDNATADFTIETGGNASDANDTAFTTPTTPLVTTPSPAVFVDPREFETDDLSLECPLPRLNPETTSISVSPPSALRCADLPVACFNCSYDYACTYGAKTTVSCTTDVDCMGEKTIERDMTCQYCFQTKFGAEHVCTLRNGPDAGGCHVKKSPSSKSRFRSNCTVKPHVLCLGRRTFHKMLPCNWTSGYRWTTSLILSIFLGGFGADRFYLGQWRQGIGKLFSFGGLGVWTVIDVILIAIGYIGPWDESLYIY